MLIWLQNVYIQQKQQHQAENGSIKQKMKIYIGVIFFLLKIVNTKHKLV